MSTSSAGSGMSLIAVFMPQFVISLVILFFASKKIITIRKEKTKKGEIRKLNIVFKIFYFCSEPQSLDKI